LINDFKKRKEGGKLGRINKDGCLITAILVTILMFSTILQLNVIHMLSPISVVLADRGMIPVIPLVSIYESAQKAIIAWNGQEEILILSTDVTSTDNTTVLEILPLPSNSIEIKEASLKSFNVVQELIWYHMPKYLRDYGPTGNETAEVRVVFHEKIGMHDITVIEAHDVSEFAEWMNKFLLKNGINQQVSLEDLGIVIEDYMLRDFHFYVLDLIELSSDQKSVEPILYKFSTSYLYYPLYITSPIGTDGKIILFLITEDIIERGYDPLRKAQYNGAGVSEPIQLEVSNEELSLIEPSIAELFGAKAWMTALTYEGPLNILTKDIAIRLLRGDLNADGKVDLRDIHTAARTFGSVLGDPRWNPRADINKDNVVNLIDIFLIAINFGKTLEYQASISSISNSLKFEMTVERTHIDIGDSINIELTLKNIGNETLMIWFGSGQSFDLYLYYGGFQVAKWSDGMFFIMIVWELHLEPGETYTQKLNWNFYRYNPETGNRYPPQPGNYELVGVCVGRFHEMWPAIMTPKMPIELS